MVLRVAILDDYLDVAMSMADWNSLSAVCECTVFRAPFESEDEAAIELSTFDVLVCMRDRTAFPASLIERLGRVKFIVTAGHSNQRMDMDAAQRRGIPVCGTRMLGINLTVEHAWALILSLAKRIRLNDAGVRAGRWQTVFTEELAGRTLAVFGLGRIGIAMATIARAFGMRVIAWSQNITPEICACAGAEMVSRDELFRQADFLTLHVKLSERTRHAVGPRELGLMKPTAFLINTARGGIVDEDALVKALEREQIAGAALEVFSKEPLPSDHPLTTLENVILTPHVSFVERENFKLVYSDAVQAIKDWIAQKPLMILNPTPGHAPNAAISKALS